MIKSLVYWISPAVLFMGTHFFYGQKVTIQTVNIYPEWIIVRQLYGDHQKYLFSVDSTHKGKFVFSLKKYPPGEYLIQFSEPHIKPIRFLSNNRDIDIKINAINDKPRIILSGENAIYENFLKENERTKKIFRELKRHFQHTGNPSYRIKYDEIKQQYYRFVDSILNKTKNTMVHTYIRHQILGLPPGIYRSEKKNISMWEIHFLDRFHPDSLLPSQSHLAIKIADEFIFGIPVSSFGNNRREIYKKRIRHLLEKINNQTIKSEIIIHLIKKFSAIDRNMVRFMVQYHQKLPGKLQDGDLVNGMLNSRSPIVGGNARISVLIGNQKTLKLKKSKYYLILFNSFECLQCQRLLPQLKSLLINKTSQIQVILVNFNLNENKLNYYKKNYKKWVHLQIPNDKMANIIGLYRLKYLPTALLTDENFRILEKVWGQKDILAMLDYYKLYKTHEKRRKQ